VSQQSTRFPFQQCVLTMRTDYAGCLVPVKNATDRNGRAHKVFFAHARASGTSNKPGVHRKLTYGSLQSGFPESLLEDVGIAP
jgi:hypothetical protein